MENSFPKFKRVIRGDTFTIVLRRGGCAADDCLVVFAYPISPDHDIRRRGDNPPACRLGVTIPKKAGNAVVRNQWKRWIRESFRTQQSDFPAGYDFVVRPKKGAQGNWRSIRKGLPRLAKKAVRRLSEKR